MLRILLVGVFVAFVVRPVSAEMPKTASKTKAKWTADDVLLQETAADFQVSPDGKWVLWVKSAQDTDKGETLSHIRRSSLTDRDDLQLTRGTESCDRPRWSPDGKRIAFLSKRSSPKSKKDDGKPKTQVWLMDASGGEPWQLTDGDRDVKGYGWAGDDAVVFIAREAPSLREKTAEDKEDDSMAVEDEKYEQPVRMFKFDIEEKKTTRLTTNKDWIDWINVSPDGKHAVALHQRSLRYTYDNKTKPVAFLYDLETGAGKPIFQDAKLNLHDVRWAADSKGFYATSQFTNHPRYMMATVTELYWFDLAKGSEQKIDLNWERGLAQMWEQGDLDGIVAMPDGFLALLSDGARHKAARYVRSGEAWKREWLDGEHAQNIFALAAADEGKTILYGRSRAAMPTQWYCARLDGVKIVEPLMIAKVNEGLRKKPMSRVEIVRWKGALDQEIEGVLYYPHDWKEGRKYPLLLMIHGGPFGADYDSWDDSWAYPAHLYAQHGMFVLKPNYHGSSNYGLAFAESISNGKYYDLPLKDIETGVDSLIAKGLVDPQKIATQGWSNGAILSVALLTRSARYKAACLGAGGAEWVGDWGACEFGQAFSNYYFGKAPIEDPQLYIKMAPLYQFDKVKTPTIIFQGDADRAVPVHHGWSQFRTLQALGKVDVRLILFPDEEHSPKKLVHRRRKIKEELAWLEKHFLKSAKDENPAVKKGSPLDRAVKLKAVKKDGRLYGVREKDVLIPETVEFEGLTVGRFEVTAAQFAAFDKSYKMDAGHENYPAIVSFDKAKAYCEWLSKQTGRAYRLPDEDNASTLYDDRDDGENTLDHWAGYAPNPEDAARLLEESRKLAGSAPLLRPVGSFKPAGDDIQVFDLGGNAAEWTTTADGKAKAAGGCAALPSEGKETERKPPAEYVGFRVVLDAGKK